MHVGGLIVITAHNVSNNITTSSALICVCAATATNMCTAVVILELVVVRRGVLIKGRGRDGLLGERWATATSMMVVLR